MFLYCYPVRQKSNVLPSSRGCRPWDFWHCIDQSFAHFPPTKNITTLTVLYSEINFHLYTSKLNTLYTILIMTASSQDLFLFQFAILFFAVKVYAKEKKVKIKIHMHYYIKLPVFTFVPMHVCIYKYLPLD